MVSGNGEKELGAAVRGATTRRAGKKREPALADKILPGMTDEEKAAVLEGRSARKLAESRTRSAKRRKSPFAPGGYVRHCPLVWCPFTIITEVYTVCPHHCVYCFANLGPHALKRSPIPKPYDWRNVLSAYYKLKRDEDWYFKGHPIDTITLGINTDPFPVQEREYKATETLIRALAKQGIWSKLLTKAPDNITDSAADLITERGALEVTFTTFNDDYAGKTEPMATLPSKRMEAMFRLAKRGVPVGIRLAPWVYDTRYSVLSEDFLKRARDAGINRLSAHALNACYVNKHKEVPLWQAIGESRESYYSRMSETGKKPQADLLTPRTAYGYDLGKIRPHVEALSGLVKRYMKFGLCGEDQGYPFYDLCDGPYGCCVREDMSYDRTAPEPMIYADKEAFKNTFIDTRLWNDGYELRRINVCSSLSLLPTSILEEYTTVGEQA